MDKQKYLNTIDEVIANGKFKDNWDSLSQYEVPQWYKNAKFGIFIHWGIYSVPAFHNEWYSRNMYVQGHVSFEHHLKTYGSQKDFGYKDFIPLFKAEHFDAEKWADLFEQAGAKYVVPVAEHHDGFQMYKSEISHWNSFEMGPHHDVLGELSAAFNKRGIVNGASSHRIEHWFFMGHGKEFESDVHEPLQCGDFYWPAQPQPDTFDIFSKPDPSQEFLEDWLVRTCEIVDKYHPKTMYFDWWIHHSAAKPYLKKFAAYYYNRAIEWGEGVAINYKHDAFEFGTAVVDVERGQFAEVKPFFWQTDTAIAKNSWCYTENNDFKQAKDLLCTLVDVVSKNGCLLLNVGPKADGTFTEEDTNILLEIGAWLKVNGEAIYNTHIWRVSCEGPTKVAEGQFTDAEDTIFTKEDIRFTMNGSYLYATCLNYPDDGKICISSLFKAEDTSTQKFQGIIRDIEVLGFDEKPEYTRDASGLHLTTKNVHSDKPVVFKLLLD